MDRINGADTIDIGGDRRGFRDENLVAGAAGTEVTALFLNMVQEEILKVITEAGLAPSEGDWTQLWQALQIFGLSPDRSRRWLAINSMTLSSAPGAPAVGDAYLVPTGATGIWAAHVGKIAVWFGSGWTYLTPTDGHGVSLPDGRVFERVGGQYIEKIALDAQSGKWISATDIGAINALSITLVPAPASRPAFLIVRPSFTNTGAATLTVGGFASVAVLRRGGAALVPGDLTANVPAALAWNGVAYELINPVAPVPGTGFTGRRSNQGWLPATAATSTLTATFTAPSTGMVIVFSTVNKSYSGGSNPNIANVALIDGVAGASDLVNLSTTSITSSLVLAGASVTVSSKVTVESAPTVNLSQYLNYIFIPA